MTCEVILSAELMQKIRGNSLEIDAVNGIEWIIDHSKKSNEENGELRRKVLDIEKENEELKKELKGFQLSTDRTADENEKIKKELDGIYKSNEKKNVEYTKHIKTYEELKKERCDLLKSNEYLEKENEELKERIAELEESEKQSIETMKIMGINCIGDLVKQNEELKDQLRTIQQMDCEEPDSRIEELLNTVQDLENQKTGLWDDIKLRNERIKKLEYEVHDKNLTIETMQSNIDYERGQKIQANKTIKDLIESISKR